MKNIVAFFMTVLACGTLLLGAEGRPIGGEPYASWDAGGIDYFVMFNSLVDDQITLYGEGTNRQADTCILESYFVLKPEHIPLDAVIEKAYLVWMGAVDQLGFNEPTDNAVHLKFAREDDYIYETDITVGDYGKMLGDTFDPFQFESVRFTASTVAGCTETNPGTVGTGEVAYFTYRTDATSFFQKISDDNHLTGTPLMDGTALQGTYTFSGLNCTNDDAYRCNGTMVSSWSLILIYRSGMVRSKEIYLYPGLSFLRGESTTATVSGFELPKDPVVRLTAMIAEGDEGITNPNLPPELIYIRGEGATSTYILTNECNPLTGMSYEVYNSKSSMVGWDPSDRSVSCIGGGEENYLGIDVDTFLLDTEDDVNLKEHLKLGGTALDVSLSVNQDAILTNYLIVSLDTANANFNIPPEATDWPSGREKHICSCRTAADPEDAVCQDRPYYYLIKVQNWGDATAQAVVVSDTLDDRLEYIAGSTEMATQFDENGDGTDWMAIPDGPSAAFPLAGAGYNVAETMAPCDINTMTCTDTRLLRFKVKPKEGLPHNCVIENTAEISDANSETAYRTNSNVPLKAQWGTCKPLAECPEPSKAECGGGEETPVNDNDAITNADEDVVAADEPATDDDTVTTDADVAATDDTTVPDTETKKSNDGGCALVVF